MGKSSMSMMEAIENNLENAAIFTTSASHVLKKFV
jgi:hypothetical protein